MQGVKPNKHKEFAEKESCDQYYVSAKTGDTLYKAFYQIACNLCGITINPSQILGNQGIIPAQIVQSQKDDPKLQSFDKIVKKGKEKECSIL